MIYTKSEGKSSLSVLMLGSQRVQQEPMEQNVQ